MRPIVVEGPDGAGKSTLLAKLARDLGREAVHTGGANQSLDELNQKCREQAALMLDGKILDRCTFISDPIYKMGMGLIPFLPAAILQARLWTLNPVVVYCRRANAEDMLNAILDVAKAHKPPEYLEKVRANYPRIVEGYDREMDLLVRQGFTIIRYDWMVDDYHALQRGIQACAG
jgi:GTPase SAR1 family protein